MVKTMPTSVDLKNEAVEQRQEQDKTQRCEASIGQTNNPAIFGCQTYHHTVNSW